MMKALPPWLPYVAPFVLFLLLTTLETATHLPPSTFPLTYAVKIVLVGGLIIAFRGYFPEARPGGGGWAAATALGLVLFFLWIAIDTHTPHFAFLGARTGFNPNREIATPTGIVFFLFIRFLGLVVVVPIVEELFYRGFLLRFVTDMDDFRRVPVGTFSALALLVNVALFALSHPEWLAAAVFALALCLLLRWTKNLFACILAHGVTNLLLGVYILHTGSGSTGDVMKIEGTGAGERLRARKKRNTMTRTLICAALAALTIAAGMTGGAARSQGEGVRPSPAFFSVSQGLTSHGHGEVKAKPDIARMTAGVVVQAKDQAQAAQENAVRMTALMVAIKSLKIADRDIQTQGYSVDAQYDYGNGHAPILTGYQVTNSVQVTLRDLSQAGALIDKATQAGANQLNGVSYELSDKEAVQAQALTKAVVDARRRAQAMADALGVGLGNPLSLNDGGASPPVQPIFQMRAMKAASDSAPTTPISAQEITVTADVTLVYAMGAAK